MNRKYPVVWALLAVIAVVITRLAPMFWPQECRPCFAERSQNYIYLTFDDGPSTSITPKILDVLKEENVKATFFIVGSCAETRKEIVKRQFDEGHTVAVHSYSHDYKKIYCSPQKLLEDIDRCNALIKEITGSYSTLYRFPGGSFGLNKKLIAAVEGRGMRHVDWNASTLDAEIYNPTKEQIFKAAISTPANRAHVVLLAHDSPQKTATLEALRDIIKYYKNSGYAFEKF